jgi:hypothetical protein
MYVFHIAKYNESQAEPLEQIRDKVILDIKRMRAVEAARARARQFMEDMSKEGSDFAKVAAAQKLEVSTTPFFRNSVIDPNRPDFTSDADLTGESKLVGPLRGELERGWVIADVAGKIEAPTDEFKSELSMRLANVQTREAEALRKALIPDGLLQCVGYKPATEGAGEGPGGPSPYEGPDDLF